jgi:hypothetical protein
MGVGDMERGSVGEVAISGVGVGSGVAAGSSVLAASSTMAAPITHQVVNLALVITDPFLTIVQSVVVRL